MKRICKIVIISVFTLGVYSLALGKDRLGMPNIIYILADDMGPGDVSAYNPKGKIPTPNIDRLAHEGVMFTDAHTNSSVCTPTRYGILTGRYAWRTPLKSQVLSGHSPHLIEIGRETVASLLKKQGYATACFGKWHLGMDWPSTDGKEVRKSAPKNVDFKAPIKNGPNDVGFDYFLGIAGSMNMDPHGLVENRHLKGDPEFVPTLDEINKRGLTQPSKPGWVVKDYCQDSVLAILTQNAGNWIEAHADKPFFVYFPLPSPHSPIVPSANFRGKSGLNEHGDYCMETDWVVGQVLKKLDELGIAENTLVIFTADNGTSPKANFKEMQAKGHYPSLIYRGMKGTLWEGGHRMPFVARWPSQTKAGAVCNDPICTTDLFATVADWFDVKINDNTAEDSYSFLPVLLNKKLKGGQDRMIVHHSDLGYFAVRRGKWKVMYHNQGGSNRRNPKDKPVINNADILLFDMEKDPEESTNLSGVYPEVVEELTRELAQVIQTGRSTPGTPQPTDVGKVEWPQIDIVKKYLK